MLSTFKVSVLRSGLDGSQRVRSDTADREDRFAAQSLVLYGSTRSDAVGFACAFVASPGLHSIPPM